MTRNLKKSIDCVLIRHEELEEATLENKVPTNQAQAMREDLASILAKPPAMPISFFLSLYLLSSFLFPSSFLFSFSLKKYIDCVLIIGMKNSKKQF